MEDLSIYKTTDFTSLAELRREDKQRFDKFTNRVFNIFKFLEVGKSFSLENIESSSRPIFVQLTCMAISEGYDLEFSNDYTSVRKIAPVQPFIIKIKDDQEGE